MLGNEFIYEYKNNNKSGKMSSEKYIIKNYLDDYNLIIDYSDKNDISDLPFKQKVYHIINGINGLVFCKNPFCDNLVKFKNSTVGYLDYCCNKCVSSDPKIKKKKEQTNLKKFGYKHASLSEDIKKKVKSIYNSRTEKEKEIILNKRINTVKEKYGVDNVSKLDYIQNKRVESFKVNIEKWKESYKKSSLERYGVEHPWMSDEIHNKTIKKFYENYENRIINKLSKSSYNDTFVEFNFNNNKRIKLKCDNCNKEYLIEDYNFYFRVSNDYEICTNCNPIGSNYNVSNMELQLLNFIKNNYDGEILSNVRDIINPYEIDIYLPDLKLGFEFNSLYWHSELNKKKDYHYIKSEMSMVNNIQLIQIWEDDWVYNNDIVKSMILNKLNKTCNKIYARKCEIKEVSPSVSREFLNDNHIQGFVGSKIKLGLFYNDNLVSIMTFGSLRPSMGYSPNDGDYELIRFCNKLNTNVIGGASKLFKHFLRTYKPNLVISYSDNTYSNGNLYNRLGFHLCDEDVKLNYYWAINKKREHRYNFRKSNLVKMGYNSDKSEREIMYEDVGSYRIWGAGNKKWLFKI